MVAASDMPVLSHWPGKDAGVEWFPERSEVMRWMITQPEIANWIMDHMKRRGAISYDLITGKWSGTKFKPVDPSSKAQSVTS